MKDPIVEEVRRAREALAAEFDFDLKRMSEHAQRDQYTWGHDVVSFKSGRRTVVFCAIGKPVTEPRR